MDKTYRVKVYYQGEIYFDVNANDRTEVFQLAEKQFNEISDGEIVANLNEIIIDEVCELIDLSE